MNQAMPPLSPQNSYLVTAVDGDFQLNQQVLSTLYQPLLSPMAYTLETVLAAQLQPNPVLADRRRHSELLTLMNTGAGKLEAARNQLEAVGLLRTFYQDDAVGTVFVYQLQSLLSARQFFEEDLLSTRLLQVVGEQQFRRLADSVKHYYYDPDKLQETTHQFLDVFSPDSAAIKNDHKVISEVKSSLTQPDHKVALPKDDFDFTLLAKQLQSDGLDADDIQKSHQLIMTQHLMYGIDEVKMRQLVLKAVDWGISNKIDSRQLKLVVAAEFQSPVKPVEESASTTVTVNETTNLSAQEQSLVKIARELAPVTFLATLKRQTGGGFVTSSEKYLISNLLNQGLLPEVINILSYDVIVQQELPTLRKNLVDTIANSWQRSKVVTAEQALKEIAEFNSPQKRQRRVKNYRQGGKIKEQLPDWAKQDTAKTKKKASAAQLRESQRLLAKLKKKHDNK